MLAAQDKISDFELKVMSVDIEHLGRGAHAHKKSILNIRLPFYGCGCGVVMV